MTCLPGACAVAKTLRCTLTSCRRTTSLEIALGLHPVASRWRRQTGATTTEQAKERILLRQCPRAWVQWLDPVYHVSGVWLLICVFVLTATRSNCTPRICQMLPCSLCLQDSYICRDRGRACWTNRAQPTPPSSRGTASNNGYSVGLLPSHSGELPTLSRSY